MPISVPNLINVTYALTTDITYPSKRINRGTQWSATSHINELALSLALETKVKTTLQSSRAVQQLDLNAHKFSIESR